MQSPLQMYAAIFVSNLIMFTNKVNVTNEFRYLQSLIKLM